MISHWSHTHLPRICCSFINCADLKVSFSLTSSPIRRKVQPQVHTIEAGSCSIRMVARWSGSARRLGLIALVLWVLGWSAFSRSNSRSTAAMSSSTASSNRLICLAVKCSFFWANLCRLNRASSCSYFWLRLERNLTLESNCWFDCSSCCFDYAKDWCCIANCRVNSSSCSWGSWLKSGSVFMAAVCLRSWRRGNRMFGE